MAAHEPLTISWRTPARRCVECGLIVDWTVSPSTVVGGQYGIYFNLFANQPNGSRANAGATDLVNIQSSSVPEPSQTLAGLLALAGGVLTFGARRLMNTFLV